VLFVFHGAGSDAESMVRATGLDPLADRRGFLVVYPRAVGGRYDVDAPGGRNPEVRFVQALLARLRTRFPVDDARVFATGFSNGAALCYRLAEAMPGTFAALAPVAGYLPRGLPGPKGALPSLLVVHGTRDGRLGAALATEAASRWAGWAGCPGPGTVAPLADALPWRATLREFACPAAGPRVALLLVEGAGHEWSGGPGGFLTRAVLRRFLPDPG
jgi:polyhydroxybutyrate depolymerase